MKFEEIRTRLFLTLGVCALVAIFFLLTVQVWDNTGEKFIYTPYLNSETEITINAYTGNPVNLEIPSEIDGFTVVSIADNAFASNTELKKVKIPSSVKYIEDYAFAGCTSLKSVEAEDGLLVIGYRAFYKCAYLKEFDLPQTLEKIDDEAFRECERLKVLRIPKSCTQIGNDSFRACMFLTLDCSQNEMALKYAQDNYISTSFTQSTDYTLIKVFVLFILGIAIFVAGVLICKKLFGKKEEVQIRFIDSEMSRKDKYKDGLVSDDPSKRTSARKLWLGKKRVAEEIEQENSEELSNGDEENVELVDSEESNQEKD